MNKGKFASLMMLSAFSAGVASSSAVSAQGDENLASVVDNKGASSHDDSVSIDPKVSNEPVVAADETKIDTETTTDEETKNAITDENNDARDDTENLDKDINDKADSPEDSDKENSKNKDYVFAYINKEQNVKKSKGVGMAEGLAVAGGGASTVGIATFGISKLVKTSGNDKNNKPSTDSAADPNPEPNNSKDQDDDSVKKDKSTSEPSTNSTADPIPEPDKPTGSKKEEKEPEKNPSEKPKEEEKGGFVYRFWTWYKNNLRVSIPLTYIFYIIVYMVVVEIMQQKDMRENGADGICFDLVKDDDDNDKIDEADKDRLRSMLNDVSFYESDEVF